MSSHEGSSGLLEPERAHVATELFNANSSVVNGRRVLDFDAFVASVIAFDPEEDPNEVRESLEVRCGASCGL